ncbi:MAG: DUF2085 domain-containing protein [Vampirovibrionales bacterium]
MLQVQNIKRPLFVLASLACASLALFAMMPPVLVMFKQYALYDQVMAFFAQSCHQQSTRCFWWAGFPMAICGRCLGIYLGVGYAFLRQAFEQGITWKMTMLLLFLGVCDKIIETFWGIPTLLIPWGNEIRCVSGFLAGYAVMMLLFKSTYWGVNQFRRLKT